MNKNQAKKLIILITILTVIDQILKIVFLVSNTTIGNPEGWCVGVLNKEKSENNIAYILISVIAIIALVRYIKSNNSYIKMDSRVVLSFAIAGCISNMIDRIWNGGTINYINIPRFSSLNLGYVYILVTWIGMAVILTKYTSKRINEKKDKTESINNLKKEIENEKRNNSK